MHNQNKIKILAVCNNDFISSLYELKDYLNFNFEPFNSKIHSGNLKNFDILLFQDEKMSDFDTKSLDTYKGISILIGKNKKLLNNFHHQINLPLKINDFINMNLVVSALMFPVAVQTFLTPPDSCSGDSHGIFSCCGASASVARHQAMFAAIRPLARSSAYFVRCHNAKSAYCTGKNGNDGGELLASRAVLSANSSD